MPGQFALKKGAGAVVDLAKKKIRGWHGSPHHFEPEEGAPHGRFRDEKIGTGEGAQAYGHGHYLAESRGTAQSYRDRLAGKKKWEELGFSVDELLPMMGANTPELQSAMRPYVTRDLDRMIDFLDEDGGGIEAARAIVAKKGYASGAGTVTYPPELQEAIAQKLAAAHAAKKGALYEVDIHADPERFLDWDKPLSEQSHVQEALSGLGFKPAPWPYSGLMGEKLLPETADADALLRALGPKGLGEQKLKDAGIPGIKYLDQGSRGPSIIYNVGSPAKDFGPYSPYTTKADAEKQAELLRSHGFADAEIREQAQPQSRNFTVFDPKIIEIVGKWGIAGALGAGLITSQQAEALEAQGYGGAAAKGDRLGQPTKDEVMAQRLELARMRSAQADQATGADVPSTASGQPSPIGLGRAAASGLRNAAEGALGMGGDLSFDTGYGFSLPLGANVLPGQEAVSKFTDQYAPEWLQWLTRYKPQGPVEEGWKSGVEWGAF